MTKIELARQHQREATAAKTTCEEALQKCQSELLTRPGCSEAILDAIKMCQHGIALAKLEYEMYDEYIAKYGG